MSTASYLPSEIGRIIYGYLRKNCNEDLATSFLNKCESMKECQARIQFGFDTNFQNQFSLTQILTQYSTLSELIFQNTNKGTRCSHINVVHLLRKLLEFRIGHLAEFYRAHKLSAHSKNVSSVKQSKIAGNIGVNDNHVRKNDTENEAELIQNEKIDNFDNQINVRIHRTPMKNGKSPAEIGTRSSSKPSLIQQSPMWDHSVQKILSEYSPTNYADRHSNLRDQSKTSTKKRKIEETGDEIVDVQKEVPARGKRRKLGRPRRKNCKKAWFKAVPKNMAAQELTNTNNDIPVRREFSDEIELFFKPASNSAVYGIDKSANYE